MDGMDGLEAQRVLEQLIDLIEERPGDMFDETGSGSTIQRYPTEELRVLVGRMKLLVSEAKSDPWDTHMLMGERRAACKHENLKISATSYDLQYEDHCEYECMDCGKRWIGFER